MSEYHEAFWIAVAAASPVIGLTHSVSFERYYRVEQRFGRRRPGNAPRFAYLKAFGLRASAFLGELLSGIAFLMALGSLSTRTDNSMTIAGDFDVIAFFLIVAQGALMVELGEYNRPRPGPGRD